jgi:hypothetical protein
VRRNYGATVLTDAAFRRARFGAPRRQPQQNITRSSQTPGSNRSMCRRNLINRYIPIGLLLKDITRCRRWGRHVGQFAAEQ